ncbi:Fn3_like domain-containing protein [Psidium guajava]|nr:Fn3_like domain-containing protein [Psidium guajava]
MAGNANSVLNCSISRPIHQPSWAPNGRTGKLLDQMLGPLWGGFAFPRFEPKARRSWAWHSIVPCGSGTAAWSESTALNKDGVTLSKRLRRNFQESSLKG